MLAAEQLGEVADSLIGHFVDQARRAGASWSEIGASMGVSKQAAQKRFVARGQAPATPLDPSQGSSRFTEATRAVVLGAQEEARAAADDRIEVAHLVVLALVADPQAAGAIAAQGVSLDDVRRTATATLPPAAATVPELELVPFDPHARAALEGAFAEAQGLDADAVDPGHVLLAVLAVEDGTGVLAAFGVDPAAVRVHLATGSADRPGRA